MHIKTLLGLLLCQSIIRWFSDSGRENFDTEVMTLRDDSKRRT